MQQVDAVLIGTGQGGVPLAMKWAQQGKKVTVFERGAVGGSCVNYGCTPSKTFLGAAFSQCRPATAGFPATMERVRETVLSWRDGIARRLQHENITLVRGEASFAGERRVTGGGVEVQAPLIVINTGNGPAVPDLPGLAGTPFLTYVSFWDLRARPDRAIILGGGYVGVELGQGLARMGCATTMVEKHDRIVHLEEPEVSATLTEALSDDGVRFEVNRRVSSVAHDGRCFTVQLEGGPELTAEALLVAVGQRPNTAALHAARAGVELDEKGYVRVNDRFETTAPGIYAIGDVTGRPAFTHVSWEDHRRLASILDGGARRRGDRVLGYAFFTDPQVGRAGLTLEQAHARGLRARSATLPLERVARATELGRSRGFYRMVVDEESGRILGATLVAPDAAELVHIFIALMEAGASWRTLEQAQFIHPSYAEGLPTLARKLLEA